MNLIDTDWDDVTQVDALSQLGVTDFYAVTLTRELAREHVTHRTPRATVYQCASGGALDIPTADLARLAEMGVL
ncbi:MAG: hypothetical protein NW202_13370 [Nitrospira sp.]|nr:hypothetical protein [Nitrospira sp.]